MPLGRWKLVENYFWHDGHRIMESFVFPESYRSVLKVQLMVAFISCYFKTVERFHSRCGISGCRELARRVKLVLLTVWIS